MSSVLLLRCFSGATLIDLVDDFSLPEEPLAFGLDESDPPTAQLSRRLRSQRLRLDWIARCGLASTTKIELQAPNRFTRPESKEIRQENLDPANGCLPQPPPRIRVHRLAMSAA